MTSSEGSVGWCWEDAMLNSITFTYAVCTAYRLPMTRYERASAQQHYDDVIGGVDKPSLNDRAKDTLGGHRFRYQAYRKKPKIQVLQDDHFYRLE